VMSFILPTLFASALVPPVSHAFCHHTMRIPNDAEDVNYGEDTFDHNSDESHAPSRLTSR
ncbi:MAG: hypothetical protein ABI459_11135, partial [Deltaproteobacteria bacterium]